MCRTPPFTCALALCASLAAATAGCRADRSPANSRIRQSSGERDATSPAQGGSDGGATPSGAGVDRGLRPAVIVEPLGGGVDDAGMDAATSDGDAADEDASAPPPQGVCGDGELSDDEVCDPRLHACCNSTCDGLLDETTVCRPAAGPCDVEETCDGIRRDCPADALLSDVPCGNARDPSLPCDRDDVCDGTGPACPDAIAPADTVCRARAPNDGCDAEEVCDGESKQCPTDARLPEGSACSERGGEGTCSAGLCCPGATRNRGVGCELEHPDDNLVFVTSLDYTGDLGDLEGADAICDQTAADANLAGSFSAWLSGGAVSVINAIERVSDGPYFLVDDAANPLAASRAQLRGGSLDLPPDRTEWGATKQSSVWTGSGAAGTASGESCASFTDGSATARGAVGDSGSPTLFSSDGSDAPCDVPQAIYCFQDDCPDKPAVDFASDPLNCGGCGTVCDSARCVEGRCALHVFATSTSYTIATLAESGDVHASTDALCTTAARRAGRTGNYTAWLSTTDVPARAKLLDAAFVKLDAEDTATTVAADLSDLLDGTLAAPIDLDESGMPTSALVWTGTASDGTLASANCMDFTVFDATDAAAVGESYATDTRWTDSQVDPGPMACDTEAALYCFEIPATVTQVAQ